MREISDEWLAQARLDRFVSRVDRLYDGEDGPPSSTTGDGTPYITFVSGGVKQQGHAARQRCATEKDAVEEWIAPFEAFCNNRANQVLRWRSRPVIEHDGEHVQVMARAAFVPSCP